MRNLASKKISVFGWAGLFFILIILVGLDQCAKIIAPRIFRNSVFAFSLSVPLWLMYLIYFVVLAGMLVYCVNHHQDFNRTQTLAWLLIFAGAVSNIGERIVLGYARDFIYMRFYRWTGVYNPADFYILGGVALLVITPMLPKRQQYL